MLSATILGIRMTVEHRRPNQSATFLGKYSLYQKENIKYDKKKCSKSSCPDGAHTNTHRFFEKRKFGASSFWNVIQVQKYCQDADTLISIIVVLDVVVVLFIELIFFVLGKKKKIKERYEHLFAAFSFILSRLVWLP